MSLCKKKEVPASACSAVTAEQDFGVPTHMKMSLILINTNSDTLLVLTLSGGNNYIALASIPLWALARATTRRLSLA